MSILTDLSSSFLRVRLARTGLSFSKSDKEARHDLAHSRGADEQSFRVTKLLLPTGYDAELRAVKKTLNAVYTHYLRHTVPFGQGAAGGAEGDRLLRASTSFSTTWIQGMQALSKQLDQEREALAVALPGRIAQIQADGVLGAAFDASQYPGPDDIRESFSFKLEGPEPLADGGNYTSLPLDESLSKALEKRQEARVTEKVAFMQQSVARMVLEQIKNLSANLSKLVDHDAQTSSGKAPRIFASLTDNLRHSIGMMREYAVPSTEAGRAVIELADRVEADLVPAGRTATDFKDSIPLARAVSAKAADLAADIEGMGVLFD